MRWAGSWAAVLPDGALIAFTGGLGAGKTAFCEGLAEGLGAPTGQQPHLCIASTITAALARWPTSTSTASLPRTTCMPPVSTIIWIRVPLWPLSGAKTSPSLLAPENPIHINIDRVDDTTRRITIEGVSV